MIQLAELLAEVRGEVVDLHNPDMGDTKKSLGYRAYECCRTRSTIKANQLGFEWLGVLTIDKRFTLRIGSTPVRFWRGEPEKLPSGKLLRSPEALSQIEIFPSDDPHKSLIWFCVLEANYQGLVESAYFVGYTEFNEIVVNWKIPLRGSMTIISDINHKLSESVELESAVGRLKLKKSKSDAVKNE